MQQEENNQQNEINPEQMLFIAHIPQDALPRQVIDVIKQVRNDVKVRIFKNKVSGSITFQNQIDCIDFMQRSKLQQIQVNGQTLVFVPYKKDFNTEKKETKKFIIKMSQYFQNDTQQKQMNKIKKFCKTELSTLILNEVKINDEIINNKDKQIQQQFTLCTKNEQNLEQLQKELGKLGKVVEFQLLDKKNLKQYQAIVHNISNLKDGEVGEQLFKLCEYPIRYIRRYPSYAFICFYTKEGVDQFVSLKQCVIGKRTAVFDYTIQQENNNQQEEEIQEEQVIEQKQQNKFDDSIEVSDDKDINIRDYNEINEENEEQSEQEQENDNKVVVTREVYDEQPQQQEKIVIKPYNQQKDENQLTMFITNLPTTAPVEALKETQDALQDRQMTHDQLLYATISYKLFETFSLFGKIRKTVLLRNDANKLIGSGFIIFKKEQDLIKCLEQFEIYKQTSGNLIQLGDDNLLQQVNAERKLNGFQLIEQQKLTRKQKIQNFKFKLFGNKLQVYKYEKMNTKQQQKENEQQNQQQLLTFGLKIPGAPMFDKYKDLLSEKDVQLRQRLHQSRKQQLSINCKVNPLRIQISNIEFSLTELQILKILCRNQQVTKDIIDKFYNQYSIKSFRFVHKASKLAFELSHNFNSQGLLKTADERSVIKIFIEFSTVNAAKEFIQQFDTLKVGSNRIICVFALDDQRRIQNKISARDKQKEQQQ